MKTGARTGMTTRDLFFTVAPGYSPANDPWGTAMSALFGVCDYLEAECLQRCPAEWCFRMGAGGPDTDDYAYRALSALRPAASEVVRLGWLLHKVIHRLERAGYSY